MDEPMDLHETQLTTNHAVNGLAPHPPVVGDFTMHRLRKPVVYMLTTYYSDFRDACSTYFTLPISLIYVFNPRELLTVDPKPVELVNTFTLARVRGLEDRLWAHGMTFLDACDIILDVVSRLQTHHNTLVFDSMAAYVAHYNALCKSFDLTPWVPTL